jgi:hypothetical protein
MRKSEQLHVKAVSQRIGKLKERIEVVRGDGFPEKDALRPRNLR